MTHSVAGSTCKHLFTSQPKFSRLVIGWYALYMNIIKLFVTRALMATDKETAHDKSRPFLKQSCWTVCAASTRSFVILELATLVWMSADLLRRTMVTALGNMFTMSQHQVQQHFWTDGELLDLMLCQNWSVYHVVIITVRQRTKWQFWNMTGPWYSAYAAWWIWAKYYYNSRKCWLVDARFMIVDGHSTHGSHFRTCSFRAEASRAETKRSTEIAVTIQKPPSRDVGR